MPMNDTDTLEVAGDLIEKRQAERERLELIRSYVTNTRDVISVPPSAPPAVRDLAKVSKVNVLRFIARAASQGMRVVGYRSPATPAVDVDQGDAGDQGDGAPSRATDLPQWDYWQRNRLDARQIGVHKAALHYGAGYVTVLPGDPAPVIRGASPRQLTAVYGDDDTWPVYALQQRQAGWRLFDAEAVYALRTVGDVAAGTDRLEVERVDLHGAGVTPVVRFLETQDLDDPVQGVIEPHMPLQDQINITTFGLLVAQHFGAFRQRAIIGWLAESETKLLKATQHSVWTFDDAPDQIKLHEFSQTDPSGYLSNREATLQLLATLSQTPVHELLGQLVNLSADALAAARDSHNRAVGEVQTIAGESWEQVLELAGQYDRVPVDPRAFIRWADLEARSLAQAADALGKLVQMLGVPPQELWDRVPGITQDEVARWRVTAGSPDAFDKLAEQITRAAESAPLPAGS